MWICHKHVEGSGSFFRSTKSHGGELEILTLTLRLRFSREMTRLESGWGLESVVQVLTADVGMAENDWSRTQEWGPRNVLDGKMRSL